MSAAGHCRAAQVAANDATPAPKLCPVQVCTVRLPVAVTRERSSTVAQEASFSSAITSYHLSSTGISTGISIGTGASTVTDLGTGAELVMLSSYVAAHVTDLPSQVPVVSAEQLCIALRCIQHGSMQQTEVTCDNDQARWHSTSHVIEHTANVLGPVWGLVSHSLQLL